MIILGAMVAAQTLSQSRLITLMSTFTKAVV